MIMRKENTLMKIFRMLGRNIRDAFRSVFRNFSLSIASISCITITLIIVAISIMATFNVNNFTKLIREDVTMVVYIEKTAPAENLEGIEQAIERNENVLTCVKKDKEQVKLEMSESHELFNNIMSEWTPEENPLKDTFLVTVKDIEQINKTATQITNIEGVDFVDYGQKMVESLITVFKAVQKASIIVVLALIVVTVFLIMNTIKLTIFSRKREISIMRLVGASNLSIKTPFVIEGMVLGMIGSIIPIVIVLYGYLAFYNHFNGQLFSPLIKLIAPEPFIYIASVIVLMIGMVVGMIGSYRAVKKYLKV